MRPPHAVVRLVLLVVVVSGGLLQTAFSSWVYTSLKLRAARGGGVFASAEAGMRALAASGYREPREVEIVYAGPNSFDGSSPHVWYVIACVWAERRVDGTPVGNSTRPYDQPGYFFLNTTDGWVHVSEGAFPEFMGFWMRVFGLAGPGSATASHPRGDWPRSGCVRSSA